MNTFILAIFSIVAASSCEESGSFNIILQSCDCLVDTAKITGGYPNHLSFGNGTGTVFTIKDELLFQETVYGPSELYLNGDFVSTEPTHVGTDIHSPGWEVKDDVLHFKGSSEFSVCLQKDLNDFLIVGNGKNSGCTDIVTEVILKAVY